MTQNVPSGIPFGIPDHSTVVSADQQETARVLQRTVNDLVKAYGHKASFRGLWDQETTFNVGDIVVFKDQFFIVVNAPTHGVVPMDGAGFRRVTVKRKALSEHHTSWSFTWRGAAWEAVPPPRGSPIYYAGKALVEVTNMHTGGEARPMIGKGKDLRFYAYTCAVLIALPLLLIIWRLG